MFSKKIFLTTAAMLLLCTPIVFSAYEWAEEAVSYCTENKIMQGMGDGDLNLGGTLTKSQMAKMLGVAFNTQSSDSMQVKHVNEQHWSYDYVKNFQKCIVKKDEFYPDENVSREEFTASLVLASGKNKGWALNASILEDNFKDASNVDTDYKSLVIVAVERGYMMGENGALRPKDNLTRAEAAALIYRVLEAAKGNITLELGIEKTETPLIGAPQVSVEEAQAWAKAKGAHQRFVDIAPTYWKYGELTGIRPEILYAQAAKETGFGKYGGSVLPEMNNWAGIKTAKANGDKTEDHETFETPDDGVRAHFNHMAAYIGIEPIGEPHDRYYVVKKIAWAGTVKYVEELGGKWCPDLYYGYSILRNYVSAM